MRLLQPIFGSFCWVGLLAVLCSCSFLPRQVDPTAHEKLVITGPAKAQPLPENARSLIVGRWYRSQVAASGGLDEQIAIFGEDGRFLYEVRRVDAAGEVHQAYTEIGHWGISNNIHFTIKLARLIGDEVHKTDSSDDVNSVAYQVLRLSDSDFIYQSLDSGDVTRFQKVSEDFSFQ